ncbi:ParB/RepB/Spo0J family partition protein [Niveibacterium sp. SC-1]|uniref:ParB/RepB/Spo0J family partition protein n=1 Tax=Niveibacterium sp. SC-1 TaxID=3135646 RepID=UPI00311E1BFF
MGFTKSAIEFRMVELDQIVADPEHPRRQFDEVALKRLADSIASFGLIQPVLVQPADAEGRYRLIVGERRVRAARLAGAAEIPVLVRTCEPGEALEAQVFENLGQGLRQALTPREMAHALKRIARGFDSPEEAAGHFGQPATWLEQKTAPANLSPKVEALLDAGQITSCTTAVQLDKLAQKNEAKLDALVSQLEAGEKLPKRVLDSVLVAEGVKRSKKSNPPPTEVEAAVSAPAATHAPVSHVPTQRPHARADKVRVVAQLLGLDAGDEELVLDRLIDEFLALKGESNPPF